MLTWTFLCSLVFRQHIAFDIHLEGWAFIAQGGILESVRNDINAEGAATPVGNRQTDAVNRDRAF